MTLRDFAEDVPVLPIADGRALGAGAWEDDARDALARDGAVLLRGSVVREDAVELALSIIDDELLDDAFWSTPRSKVGGKTLTATEYPSPRTIQLHSEMAYMASWPRYVGFHALEVASEGGETTICNLDTLSDELADVLGEFRARKVTYRRTFQKGIDIPWQHAFQTDDRADVEALGRRLGMTLEWFGHDGLSTVHTAQGTIDAEDGRPIYFNQSHLFHASALDPVAREGLEALYGRERLPRDATFGDGSPIPQDVIDRIRAALEKHQTGMKWRAGDVLILDNLRFAHGRMPFKGTRRLHVALARLESDPVRTPLA